MSLQAWKKKFLVKLNPKRATKLELLRAAEKKWMGLSKKNIEKYDLELCNYNTVLQEKEISNNYVQLDHHICYLCSRYASRDNGACSRCPLATFDCNCGGSWAYWTGVGDNSKMLKRIRKEIKILLNKQKQ